MCIIHKDFRDLRTLSSTSFLDGNLIGLKHVILYEIIHLPLPPIKKTQQNQQIDKNAV